MTKWFSLFHPFRILISSNVDKQNFWRLRCPVKQKEGSGAQRLTRDGSFKLLEKCLKIWKQWQIKVFGVAFWLKASSELQSCCWRLNTVTDENNFFFFLFPQRSFPNYSWKEEDLDSRTSDICWIPSVYWSTVLIFFCEVVFPTEKKMIKLFLCLFNTVVSSN